MANSGPNDRLDLQAWFGDVRRYGKLVIGLTVLAGLFQLVMTFVSKPIYRASATIFIPLDKQGEGMMGLSLGLTAITPVDILMGILRSERVQAPVREATKLRQKDLDDLLIISPELPRSQVRLSVTWADEKLSMQILNETLNAFKAANREVGFSTAEIQAKYLRESIDKRKSELEAAQDALLNYVKQMKAPGDPTSPDAAGLQFRKLQDLQFQLGTVENQLSEAKQKAEAQARASIDLPTGSATSLFWRNKVKEIELEKRVAEQTYGPEAPQMKQIESRLREARALAREEASKEATAISENLTTQIAELESRRKVLVWQVAEARLVAESVPAETAELQRLYRDLRVREETYLELMKRFETSNVEAEVERVRWTILDEPYLSDEPVNKRPVRNTGIGMATGLVVSLFLATLLGMRDRRRGV